MSIQRKKIINAEDWDLAEINYHGPITVTQETKSFFIISTQFDTKQVVHIQTPLMNISGMRDFVYDENEGIYSMLLQFPVNDRKTDATNNFFYKLKEFEKKLLDDAVANSIEWFGKEMTLDDIKANFNPILNYPKNIKTNEDDLTKPAFIKVIVPNNKNNWNITLFDDSNDMLFNPSADTTNTPIDFLKNSSYVLTILKCIGIWIRDDKWGVTWKGIVNDEEIIKITNPKNNDANDDNDENDANDTDNDNDDNDANDANDANLANIINEVYLDMCIN